MTRNRRSEEIVERGALKGREGGRERGSARPCCEARASLKKMTDTDNTTLAGELEIIGVKDSTDAVSDLVGRGLTGLMQACIKLGKSYAKNSSIEMVIPSEEDIGKLCESTDNVKSLNEQEVTIWPDIVEKYREKVVLIYHEKWCKSSFKYGYYCAQFPHSIVIARPSLYGSLAHMHDGNWWATYPESCMVLDADEKAAGDNDFILDQMLEMRNSSLLVKLETTDNQYHLAFDNLWVKLIFRWGLSAMFGLVAFQSYKVMQWRHFEWKQGKSSLPMPLTVISGLAWNSLTLALCACYFFADGYGIMGALNWLVRLFFIQAFSLSRIGLNLVITIVWLDFANKVRGAKTSKTLQLLLAGSAFVFIVADVASSILLASVENAYFFQSIIPTILFASELVVGLFFCFSSFNMLRTIAKVTGKRNLEEQHTSRTAKIVLLSGFNSFFNVITLLTISVNLDQIVKTPSSFLLMFGLAIYCRLIDAVCQIMICKPAHISLFGDSGFSLTSGAISPEEL